MTTAELLAKLNYQRGGYIVACIDVQIDSQIPRPTFEPWNYPYYWSDRGFIRGSFEPPVDAKKIRRVEFADFVSQSADAMIASYREIHLEICERLKLATEFDNPTFDHPETYRN